MVRIFNKNVDQLAKKSISFREISSPRFLVLFKNKDMDGINSALVI